MGEKTPTIEQKSTFAAKSKQGQDIELVATIRFFVNPTGDVRIIAPGSGADNGPGRGHGSVPGSGADSVSQTPGRRDTEATMVGSSEQAATQVPVEESHKKTSIDTSSRSESVTINESQSRNESRSTESQDTHSTREAKERKKAQDEQLSDGGGKFPYHKDVDKQMPRMKGDCPINQFVPNPCKAVNDLTNTIKGLFSWSSSQSCAPCPGCNHPGNNVSNFTATPQPKQLVTDRELGQDQYQSGDGLLDKEIKHEV